MRKLFIDTSALVALFDKKDKNHIKAKSILEKIRADKVKMLVTDYIFDESITTVLAAAGHKIAITVGEFILSSKIIEMVWLNETIKIKAWEFFKRHADKGFSFTDCTSFIIMKELNLIDYFAFDEDFKQAGFIRFS